MKEIPTTLTLACWIVGVFWLVGFSVWLFVKFYKAMQPEQKLRRAARRRFLSILPFVPMSPGLLDKLTKIEGYGPIPNRSVWLEATQTVLWPYTCSTIFPFNSVSISLGAFYPGSIPIRLLDENDLEPNVNEQ